MPYLAAYALFLSPFLEKHPLEKTARPVAVIARICL
jgi:hypothetical protein